VRIYQYKNKHILVDENNKIILSSTDKSIVTKTFKQYTQQTKKIIMLTPQLLHKLFSRINKSSS